MSEPVVIQLRKPVMAHKEEISELTFREPSGDDYVECGYPIVFGEVGAAVQPGAVKKLGAKLANVPPSTIGSLCSTDFNAVVQVMLGFLGDQAEA